MDQLSQAYKGNWLKWNVRRRDRTFRVAVLEPKDCDPSKHSAIFWGALKSFVPSAPESLTSSADAASGDENLPSAEFSDLITFPEAFLPTDTLLETLRLLDQKEHSKDLSLLLSPILTARSES